LHDAAGVVIIPRALKAGLVFEEHFGQGVALVRLPDGRWSAPIFIRMHGAGVGGQAGIERAELFLVFRSRAAFDRALAGRFELGAVADVSAGPLGREAEIATDRGPRADIYGYSRTHGAFAGVSLAETRIHVDVEANRSVYGIHKGDVKT
jgi:lipid-binding SYLF domain-containing protein